MNIDPFNLNDTQKKSIVYTGYLFLTEYLAEWAPPYDQFSGL